MIVISGLTDGQFEGYAQQEQVGSVIGMLLAGVANPDGWVHSIKVVRNLYMVTLDTAEHARLICRLSSNLRWAGPEMAKVFVRPDRSMVERERDRMSRRRPSA